MKLRVDLNYCTAHIDGSCKLSLYISSLDSVVSLLTTFFLMFIKYESRIYYFLIRNNLLSICHHRRVMSYMRR
jgi:hypothetical protein